MDSPQMYDSQHTQQNGVMNGDMKKNSNSTSPNNNNNSSNTNNNNLTTLNNNGTTKQTAALLKQHHLAQQYAHGGNGSDLNDLNTPEISIDLQNLIDDSHFSEGLGDGLFSDILAQNPALAAATKHGVQSIHGNGRQLMQTTTASRYPSTTLAYMPQPVHSGAGGAASYVANNSGAPTGPNSDSNSSMGSDVPSIKEEPIDPQEYRRQCAASGYMPGAYPSNTATFATLTPGAVLHHQHHQLQTLGGGNGGGLPGMKGVRNGTMGHHPHSHVHASQGGARKTLKPTDKSSDEYRRRRERNNIAVRKSREKAKVRTRETEEKVKLLVKENERLQKRIELLTEELNVLRSFFSNVGLPDHLHREINKHLDSFQLQHQQQQMHMSEDRRVLDILQEYGP